MQETDRLFAFGPFELNVACCELLREGVPVAIHATPLRLLVYLVERRERTVSKQDLLDRVWPDSYVSENALTSAICAIRRALTADGAPKSWIRTERGRGYRFVADVEERPALSAAHPATAVAVLPFADMSPRHDQEHLADGLTEELIHALSQDGHLQVVARTSVFAFKGRQEDVRCIGAQLDAGSVVEGSIRSAGKRLRVTAQLIRVADGYHLWSASYDRTLEDVLALEEEIAQQIGAAIESRLSRAA